MITTKKNDVKVGNHHHCFAPHQFLLVHRQRNKCLRCPSMTTHLDVSSPYPFSWPTRIWLGIISRLIWLWFIKVVTWLMIMHVSVVVIDGAIIENEHYYHHHHYQHHHLCSTNWCLHPQIQVAHFPPTKD